MLLRRLAAAQLILFSIPLCAPAGARAQGVQAAQEDAKPKSPAPQPLTCDSLAEATIDECSGTPEGGSKREKVARLLTQIVTFTANAASGKSTGESLAESCKASLPQVDAAGEANLSIAQDCLKSIGACEDQCRPEIEAALKSGQKEQAQQAAAALKACTDQVDNAQKFLTQSKYFRNAKTRILACIAATGAAASSTSTTRQTAAGALSPPSVGKNFPASEAGAAAPVGGGGDPGEITFPAGGPGKSAENPASTGLLAAEPPPSAHAAGARPRRAVRFGPNGKSLPVIAGLGANDSVSARAPAQTRKGKVAQTQYKTFPLEVDEGGGGGSPMPMPMPATPIPYPSYPVKKERPGEWIARGTAERAYCAATAAMSDAPICKDAHGAICADNRAGVPLEIHAEPVWRQFHVARRRFHDQNTEALKQVMGGAGPAGESAEGATDSEKDDVVRRYAVQAANEAELLSRSASPPPPAAHQDLLNVYLLSYWNTLAEMLPPTADVQAAGEDARRMVRAAVSRSELDAPTKGSLLKTLNEIKVLAPNLKARAESSQDDEHLGAYLQTCGLVPLAFNAVYQYRKKLLYVCPNVFQEGARAPHALAVMTHEFGHALDAVALRDPRVYAKYVACLRANPESPIYSAHPRAKSHETEAVADLWMSRALALSEAPLFLSADKRGSTRLLRQTMGFFCHVRNESARNESAAPLEEDALPPARFRIGQIFGRDAWVRWQLGCADPCKADAVCTLQGSRYDGEERPR